MLVYWVKVQRKPAYCHLETKQGCIDFTHLLEDWFNNFISEIWSFLKKKNLAFKVLLLLDNALQSSHNINEKCLEMEVMFFLQLLLYNHVTTVWLQLSYPITYNQIVQNSNKMEIECSKKFYISNTVEII